MPYDTSVIIRLLGNHAPLPKQLRHDLYFLLLKGKNPKSYCFVKSYKHHQGHLLARSTSEKSWATRKITGASSVTVIWIWAFRSLAELWHINAVQAFWKLRIPTTSFRTYLIKTILPPSVYSTCNPTWPSLTITEKDTWPTCQGDSLQSENNKHGFPIVLPIYLLKKLFSQQKKNENATWKSVSINLDLQQRNVEIARTMN